MIFISAVSAKTIQTFDGKMGKGFKIRRSTVSAKLLHGKLFYLEDFWLQHIYQTAERLINGMR